MISPIERFLIQYHDKLDRNEYGTPIYEKKLQTILDNLLKLPELQSQNYTNYYDFFNNLLRSSRGSEFQFYSIPEKTVGDEPYIGTVLHEDIWKAWKPQDNIFIAAGTGRGKNTFIKKELLQYLWSGKVVIFENRESLMQQQILDMVREIDPGALHDPANSEGMIYFYNDNYLLISYQTASIKCALQDRRFLEFCSQASYFIFDEVHFILDDAYFNKGISFFVNHFFPDLRFYREMELQQNRTLLDIAKQKEEIRKSFVYYNGYQYQNPLRADQNQEIEQHLRMNPQYTSLCNLEQINLNKILELQKQKKEKNYKATRIFMSASMEEFYSFLQMVQPFDQEPNEIHPREPLTGIDRSQAVYPILCEANRGGNPYQILSMPTDYDFIKPYQYTKLEDIVEEIKKSPDNEKWLVFVNSIEKGIKLKEQLKKAIGESVYFLKADNKMSPENKKVYKSLVEQCCFDCRVLIATTVIYNGVNVKDPRVKHIVIPFTTPSVVKQLIGRKRLDEKEKGKSDSVNIYFHNVKYAYFCSYVLCPVPERTWINVAVTQLVTKHKRVIYKCA